MNIITLIDNTRDVIIITLIYNTRDVIIITLIDNARDVIIITLIDNTRDVIIITLIDNTNMIESKLYTTGHFMVPCKVRFFLFKCTIESEIQDGRHHRIFFLT